MEFECGIDQLLIQVMVGECPSARRLDSKREATFGPHVTGLLCCQGSNPGGSPTVPAPLVSEDGHDV